MSNLHLPLPRATVSLILVVVTLACALPGLGNNQEATGEARPAVTISSPTAGQTLEPGQEINIQSTSISPEGIVRVELLVDGQVIWVDANADPQPNTPFIVAQPWQPDIPGPHTIQVRAYNESNLAGQSEPLVIAVRAAAPPPTAIVEPGAETSTPVSIIEDAPTATATARPAPTEAAPTPTIPLPTPSVTPTPGTFAPTGFEPDGRFHDIWTAAGGGDSRLGYPLGPAVTDRDFARQYFERGMMYWWDNPDEPDYIWVIDKPKPDLNSGTSWNRYVEDWDSGDEYACDAARANGDKGPVRGFGQLWCQRPEVQARLGNPREREAGSGGNPPFAQVQFFQGGVMLYNPINSEVFVLFDQGDWQRFGY